MNEEIIARLDELEKLIKASDRLNVAVRRLRVVKCTQAEFDRLPAMVSRSEFLDWTGYSASELREEVEADRIKVYRPKNHTKARYYKAEIARLGGWKM